jgi:hypothetical protein
VVAPRPARAAQQTRRAAVRALSHHRLATLPSRRVGTAGRRVLQAGGRSGMARRASRAPHHLDRHAMHLAPRMPPARRVLPASSAQVARSPVRRVLLTATTALRTHPAPTPRSAAACS